MNPSAVFIAACSAAAGLRSSRGKSGSVIDVPASARRSAAIHCSATGTTATGADPISRPSAAARCGVRTSEIGEVGGDRLRVDFDGGSIDEPVADLRAIWRRALPEALDL